MRCIIYICFFWRQSNILCNFLRNSNLSVLYTFFRNLNKSVCIRRWLGICWWFEILVVGLFQWDYPFSITSTITDLTAPSIPPVGLKNWYSAHNSATEMHITFGTGWCFLWCCRTWIQVRKYNRLRQRFLGLWNESFCFVIMCSVLTISCKWLGVQWVLCIAIN